MVGIRGLPIAIFCLIFPAPETGSALDMTLAATFEMNFVSGDPGPDLLSLLGHANGYEVVLHDVTFTCRARPGGDEMMTEVHADSFDFRFVGEDSGLLNKNVGQYFSCGWFTPDTFITVWALGGGVDQFSFNIRPANPDDGVSMEAGPILAWGTLEHDRYGCPVLAPFQSTSGQTVLFDLRGDSDGNVAAINSGKFTLDLVPATATEATTWGVVKGLYR
jgi:hypothetical protein